MEEDVEAQGPATSTRGSFHSVRRTSGYFEYKAWSGTVDRRSLAGTQAGDEKQSNFAETPADAIPSDVRTNGRIDEIVEKFPLYHHGNDLFSEAKRGLTRIDAIRASFIEGVAALRAFLHQVFAPQPLVKSRPGARVLEVSFVGLQRMRLRKLQLKLVRRIMEMRYSGNESEDWEDLLQQYITAIQDNDFIHSCVNRDEDPFIVTSTRKIDAFVLRAALESIPSEQREEQWRGEISFAEPIDKSNRPIGGTRQETNRKQMFEKFLVRLSTAIIGGSFLIGPMWLMVLRPQVYTGLISTTAFVSVFGLLMTWLLDSPRSVLSTTAAYAAVLVVFVGTNTVH